MKSLVKSFVFGNWINVFSDQQTRKVLKAACSCIRMHLSAHTHVHTCSHRPAYVYMHTHTHTCKNMRKRVPSLHSTVTKYVCEYVCSCMNRWSVSGKTTVIHQTNSLCFEHIIELSVESGKSFNLCGAVHTFHSLNTCTLFPCWCITAFALRYNLWTHKWIRIYSYDRWGKSFFLAIKENGNYLKNFSCILLSLHL